MSSQAQAEIEAQEALVELCAYLEEIGFDLPEDMDTGDLIEEVERGLDIVPLDEAKKKKAKGLWARAKAAVHHVLKFGSKVKGAVKGAYKGAKTGIKTAPKGKSSQARIRGQASAPKAKNPPTAQPKKL